MLLVCTSNMAKNKPGPKNKNQAIAKFPDQPQLHSSLELNRSKMDKLAILITRLLGSMLFLVICLIIFSLWICWNLNFFVGLKPFDPFPFPILEMSVSLFAIILSISVLINQNRQGRLDKLRQQVEFEVNVRAESEITKVLNMLHEIHQHLGLKSIEDVELEEMKEQTDIQQIHEVLNQNEQSKIISNKP